MTTEQINKLVDDINFVRGALATLSTEEAGDKPFDEDQQTRWDDGIAFVEEKTAVLERMRKAAELSANPLNHERGDLSGAPERYDGAPNFNRGDDPYDLSTLSFNTTQDDLRGRALTAIEQTKELPDQHREAATKKIQELGGAAGAIILATGSEEYRRAWQKRMAGAPVSEREWQLLEFSRVPLAIGAGASGNFAVPFTLDPTVIDTSTPDVSAVRRLSRNVTTLTNEWNGVTSAGVTAQFQAEATEAIDNAPALAQITITCHKMTVFVPYSIEVSMDWAAMESEVRRMIGVARGNLEAQVHVTGTGTNEPLGIVAALAGGASEINTAALGALAAGDVFALDDALPNVHRNGAQFLGDKPTYNAIRQLGTTDGFALWTRLQDGNPGQLIGYTANEATAMDSDVTNSGDEVLILGDFQAGFITVDRMGMVIENIPHLFGATNRFPTGERGFYAYLRTGSGLQNADAFRMLQIQ